MQLTPDQITVFAILCAALVFFAWGRFRYDLVALGCLIAGAVSGVIDTNDAFVGFGHPAVITVASVLIISRALRNSGVVDVIAEHLMPYTKNQLVHIAALTGVVALASSFMNNVGALALMLPVALATAAEHQRSPATILMPLAFGSILGGMTTMIGTPPNVIIASYRADIGGQPFSMFDFSPVGYPVAIVGVLFVAVIGWRLIPKARLARNAPQQLFEISDYLTEVRIVEGSRCLGKTVGDIEELDANDIVAVGFARDLGRAGPISPRRILEPSDVLILQGDPVNVATIIEELRLELITGQDDSFEGTTSGELELAEAVVKPGSPIEGRTMSYLKRRSGGTLALVAMARSGEAVRRRLRRQVFAAGDILLLQGKSEALEVLTSTLGLIPLARRDIGLGRTRRVLVALGIFVTAIGLGVANVVPLTISFLIAIVAYAVLGILPVRELYENVDWPVIVLLGAMIPVGRALETTGATVVVADNIVSMTSGLEPWLILTLVLIVTMFLSDIINNAATALVMAPISVGIAAQLGVNADAFLMAVAVGASCAFLTPIGHQSNTLVLGPGGYEFTDYWRMGLPLEIVIVALSVPLILLVWPLTP
jgi:di/tricarboxylate transporter